MVAPKVKFITKIMHPNVSRHGDIGLSILTKDGHQHALSIHKLLLCLQSIMCDPYTNVSNIKHFIEQQNLRFSDCSLIIFRDIDQILFSFSRYAWNRNWAAYMKMTAQNMTS